MTYRFYNRSGTLYVRVNLGEQNKKIVKSCRAKIGNRKVINNKMEKTDTISQVANDIIYRVEKAILNTDNIKLLAHEIEKAISEDNVVDDVTVLEFIRNYIKGLQSGEIKPQGRRVSPGTIQGYESAANAYEEYVGAPDNDLMIFQNDIMVQQNVRIRAEVMNRCRLHFEGFRDYLLQSGYKASTVQVYIIKVGAVLKFLKRRRGVDVPVDVHVSVLDTPPYVWPVSFTKKFLSYDFNDEVANVCKLQILSCLRPGDVLSLNRDNFSIKMVGGRKQFVVEKVNQKGQVITQAPIPENYWRAAVSNFDNKRRIMIECNRTRYCRKIQEFISILGGDKLAATIHKQVGHRIEPFKTNLLEATTPHTLRKAGINLYKYWGVDDDTIQGMYSGHRSDDVYKRHYVSKGNQDNVNRAMKLAGQL